MNLELARNDNVFGLLQGEMDRLFGSFFPELRRRDLQGGQRVRRPAVNLREDEHNVFVESELPGVSKADLTVSFADGSLTIRGERSSVTTDDTTAHRVERHSGSFERVIQLHTDVNPEAINASLKDGVLTVTLPKAEAVKPRKIQVK